MKTRISLVFAVILVGFLTLTTQVFAEGSLPFEITPKFTEDQKEGIESYFHIDVDGNSKEDVIEFTVKNIDTETKDLVVNVVNAFTSPNGVVQYTKEGSENSEIIDSNYEMTNHLELEGDNVVTIEAGEETTVRAVLNVEDVTGTLLGGLSFQLYGDEENLEQEGSSFQINNKINMVFGVMLNFNSDEIVNFEVGEPFVDPMPSYYAIRLPITLDSPILKKVNVDYDVLYKGESVFDGYTSFDFAPKSKVNISIPWEAETIKNKEDYEFVGTMEYLDVDGETKQQEVNFTFDYSPESDVVKEVTNALTRPFEEDSFPWLLVIAGVVIIGGAVFFLMRKKELYILTQDDLIHGVENPSETDKAFPKVIREDSELFDKLNEKEKNSTDNQVGVYEKRKNSGEIYYRLNHVQIYDGDRVYKINK